LAIRSTSARAILLKGILAECVGDLKMAEECFQQSSRENPADGSATAHLGRLRWTQGDRAAALSLIERAFILSPTDDDILATFKEMAGQTGKQELLLQRLQDGLAFYPRHRGMLYAFAEVCTTLKKFDDAYRTLKEGLLEFGPEKNLLQQGCELQQRIAPARKKTQKPMLSVCVIMKNEETNLVRLLASIDGIADEIIVVDTGSTDNSKAVCAFFGASVHDAEWQEDFSAARNESIARAAGSWILVLDADEVIAQSDHAALRELIEKKSRKKVAYSLQLRDYVTAGTLGGWNPNTGEYREEMGDGWFPGAQVRLFPNDKQIRFQDKVHETVNASLAEAGIEIKACDVVIHHYGRLHASHTPEKAERALAIARMKLQESGQGDTNLLTELALQEQGLQHFAEALELWERLVKAAPKDINGWLGVGRCSIKLQKYQNAVSALRKALEYDPEVHEGLVLLAQAYVHLGRTSDAVVLLEEYCESNRNDGFAHVVLAAAYICHDRDAKAQRVMRWLREQQIAYDEFMNGLAQSLRAEGKEMFADALETAAMPPQANKRW
jgi:tetratricopeptide (TPR) repeat protein